VKGLHGENDRYIILPRYVPDSNGDKVSIDGTRYTTLKTFEDQIRYVKSSNLKRYLTYSSIFDKVLPLVPVRDIEYIYDPVERAQELRKRPNTAIEHVAAEFLDLIYTCVSKSNVGIVGSLLAGFVRGVNDIDVVILDLDEGIALLDYIRDLKERRESLFRIKEEILYKTYLTHSRTLQISYEYFRKLWSKRVLEGAFRGVPYFIRILAMSNGDPLIKLVRVRKLGKVNITLRLKRVKQKFQYSTPCMREIYSPSNSRRLYIMSDRGIFTDTLDFIYFLTVINADIEQVIFEVYGDVYSKIVIYLGPECSVIPMSFL